jgi:hypothetical protein
MTGPRPAGRPWTFTDDDMLRKLLASGMKAPAIAPEDEPRRRCHPIAGEQAEGEGEMTRNRSLLLGVGIGLFGALAVLTARYVSAVLAG